MSEIKTAKAADTPWQQAIREHEETVRIAFLKADVATLDRFWSDGFLVNSPLQKVLPKGLVLDLLRAGRIRHLSFELVIENLVRTGDTVVVMGSDRVTDPPDGVVSTRRFTNIWVLENGAWRTIARHAHVVAREAGAPQRS